MIPLINSKTVSICVLIKMNRWPSLSFHLISYLRLDVPFCLCVTQIPLYNFLSGNRQTENEKHEKLKQSPETIFLASQNWLQTLVFKNCFSYISNSYFGALIDSMAYLREKCIFLICMKFYLLPYYWINTLIRLNESLSLCNTFLSSCKFSWVKIIVSIICRSWLHQTKI